MSEEKNAKANGRTLNENVKIYTLFIKIQAEDLGKLMRGDF